MFSLSRETAASKCHFLTRRSRCCCCRYRTPSPKEARCLRFSGAKSVEEKNQEGRGHAHSHTHHQWWKEKTPCRVPGGAKRICPPILLLHNRNIGLGHAIGMEPFPTWFQGIDLRPSAR